MAIAVLESRQSGQRLRIAPSAIARRRDLPLLARNERVAEAGSVADAAKECHVSLLPRCCTAKMKKD
jgi:hypothetical protein